MGWSHERRRKQMPRVVHFEIPADDPNRAVGFYTKVFGWDIKKWDGLMDYWLVMTGDKSQPGIDGGIMIRRDAAQVTVNTVDVPSVDDFVKKIEEAGGKVVVPKMAVPGVGWVANCTDTEGNLFGIMHEDPQAK
jgi:predicted enzyme related to lactoylglutathione lyase